MLNYDLCRQVDIYYVESVEFETKNSGFIHASFLRVVRCANQWMETYSTMIAKGRIAFTEHNRISEF